MDEDTIKELREADWEAFKAERRFHEHFPDMDTYIDWQAADESAISINSAQDLLEEIDNEELHRLLLSVDKLTLQIAICKMDGYTSAETSQKCGLSINAIDLRIWHLKRKLKNIL